MTLKGYTKLLLLLMTVNIAVAADNHVITINLNEQGDDLLIEPKLNFSTSQDIKEAIDNGIRVQFIIKAQLYEPYAWWFDEIIEHTKITLEVSYFTLGKLYLVKNKNTTDQLGFNEYEQVWENIEKMMTFRYNLSLAKDKWFKLRIMLDKGALPTAMQLPVLFDPNWDVNTPWYQHDLSRQ